MSDAVAETPEPTRWRPSLFDRILQYRWCYLFMLPSTVLAVMFTFYPMVMSWYFSFLRWSGFTSERAWVGLENYRQLIADEEFWAAFGRSFLFVLVAMPIQLLLSLLVAILLNNQAMRLAPIFRTFFFLPVVTTGAIIGIVMTFVFSPFNGPVNELLGMFGIPPIDFLGNPDSALWTVMLVFVWKNFGITMIYWLAALQTVPTVYYEAARVDGAGRWSLFRYITAPILIPFAIIIVLLSANATLHAFAIVQAMTGGGPAGATETIEVFIYTTAFADQEGAGVPRLGYASAAGCFFGVTVMVIALVQVWAARRVAATRAALANE